MDSAPLVMASMGGGASVSMNGSANLLDRLRAAEPAARPAAGSSPQASAAAVSEPAPGAPPSRAAVLSDEPPAVAPAAVRLDAGNVPKAVHDITLELNSGSERAAVRLVERGGEVHIQVRTPDDGLAANLRQALPGLSAKLEATGFRPAHWQTGAAPRHPPDSASGAARQDHGSRDSAGSQSGRRDNPQQQREGPEAARPKKEGKDFAWFMSSLA